jgi:hypothetical protein
MFSSMVMTAPSMVMASTPPIVMTSATVMAMAVTVHLDD